MLVRTYVVLCLLTASLFAQKRPLTHADYDAWHVIQNQRLSNDGKFVAYALFPEDGDGELVVRNLATSKEWRFPAGARPPEPPADYAHQNPDDPPPPPPGLTIAFTSDNQTLVSSTFPPKADVEKAKRAKAKPEDMPKRGLLIVNLQTGQATRVERVKSFQVAAENAAWLAYLKEAGDGAAKTFGTELVLRNIPAAKDTSYPDVTEYVLSKDAGMLVYTVASHQEDTNGVYVVNTSAGATPKPILSRKGKYAKPALDPKTGRLAFLSNRDDAASPHPKFNLYTWDSATSAPVELVSQSTPGFQPKFVLSGDSNIIFSQDGRDIFFGAMPEPAADTKTDDRPRDERPDFDLWHWKDDYIQPMQKVRAQVERTRSYRVVYHFDENKFVQLANREMSELTPSEQGHWALGGDDREYRSSLEYDDRYTDSYLVNTLTGERKLLAKKHLGRVTWSPDSKYVLLFNGKDWSTISVPDGKTVNLTAKIGLNFWTEENDTPGTPQSYGTAGWTKDGKYVLLYDHYDVWQCKPDGSIAVNLTGGYGRKNHLMFRYVRLDADPAQRTNTPHSIDPAEALLLRAENYDTHETGFFRTRIDAQSPPEQLLLAPKNFSAPVKAKNADVYLLTESTFREFPDLRVTDSHFRDLRQVTHANPQQSEYLWGTTELVHYKNADGVRLNATLYKPENFDPQKKYPMLVYIYERLSQNVNSFINPAPGHSINISYYVSNGYLVLTPDIVYKVGYPGQSALKCVLPAVQEIVDRGFVDEKAIGIQGHSWGGYQIAYMITQTNRFRAVEAGAPVADMISAYDGIRWGPGLPRQFQYERTQSRIGGSLWEYPLRYIENSPVFMADRVTTPVLMLANDADDAVPWYQGIEYYLALRRLGKETYLLNYHGEPHHLIKRANQMDYTIRMQQYFDYYLKSGPKPDWMEKGIPYIDNPSAVIPTDASEQN